MAADGTSDTSPAVDTCRVQPGGDGTLLLSTSAPGPSFKDGRPPTRETYRERTDPGVSQELANGPGFIAKPLSELGLHLLDNRDRKHESILGRNEAIAMLESPAGSSQKPQSPEVKTANRPREVTYSPSAAGSSKRDGRPSRQDSAYYPTRGMENSGSEVDFDVQARQLRARERIIIRRQRVRRTRRQFKICREKVQRLRDKVRDAVDKLTRKINELKALKLDLHESIDPYYERLRVAQDELGPAEDDFDSLERKLDEEEDDLEEEEDYFYRRNDLFNISVPETKIDVVLSPHAEPLPAVDSEPPDLVLENSLVREYLEKVEEAERLKEDVAALENEYFKVSGNATFRRRHNIPISEATSKFLDDYPRQHAEVLSDLHKAEDDLFDMRDKCLEQGLFTESDYIYEPRDELCDDVMDSVYEARDRSPIRLAAYHLRYDEKGVDFGDKKDYVNKWMLQLVEESSVGALLLQAFIYFEFRNNTEKLGDKKWSELAVENWDNDHAGDSANKNNRESRLDAIAGITPGAAGKIHATSTGRSGVSSSLRTLDVLPDQESLTGPPMAQSESASYPTQHASPTTPRRQRASSMDDQITPISLYDESTPNTAQVRIIDNDNLELADEATSPTQESVNHTNEKLSISIQSAESITTSDAGPSPQTPCTDTEFMASSQLLSSNIHEEPQLTAQSTVNTRNLLCEAEPHSQIDTANLSNQLNSDHDSLELPAPASPSVKISHCSPNLKDDIVVTPKARPTVENSPESDNIAILSLDAPIKRPDSDPEKNSFELISAFIPPEDTISSAPDLVPVNNVETETEALATPALELPTIATSTDNPHPSTHQRAKSDDVWTVTRRTSNDPARRLGPTLQPSNTHTIRHRRSLSPSSSFFSTASRTLRRISSYGAIQHVDPDLSPT